ncbi:hypothetical protein BpHYR1_041004 [Brachionus plicatilis]|uniref:Uncharacterized protein n=1 Tax=Brachionus plicatilis TaxID=10195 RepID=A0A3M7QXV2_BRAPC|nr:hypothetical protein BpHYR1_041004 [Brachionus plicatilis]
MVLNFQQRVILGGTFTKRNTKNQGCLKVTSLKLSPSPGFKILNIGKTFMLKLQENSDIWQIYCIRQPKKIIHKISLQNTLQFSAFCTPFKTILINCAKTNIFKNPLAEENG